MSDPSTVDPWQDLRAYTRARIALGRAGNSQPTAALLAFGVAHAQARDAVHQSLDVAAMRGDCDALGLPVLHVRSAADGRESYLRRPDLGRRLHAESRGHLAAACRARVADHHSAEPADVVFVIADGLSAIAVQRHAVPLLVAVRKLLPDWAIGPVVIAEQSRVALGDEIGAALGARQVVMLIGERPGLSSPDSLGIYLTYAPREGRTDAERNCISNVRPEGLSYEQAAARLAFLLRGARTLGRSGVDLKDDSDALLPANDGDALPAP